MMEVSFAIPELILESLPEDASDTVLNIKQAVERHNFHINQAIIASDEIGARSLLLPIPSNIPIKMPNILTSSYLGCMHGNNRRTTLLHGEFSI